VLESVAKSLNLQATREYRNSSLMDNVRADIRFLLRRAKEYLLRLGVIREPTPQEKLEKAIIHLTNNLRIEPSIDSLIIRISYRDPDPVMARKVANQIVDEYLRQHLVVNLKSTESSFFAEQVKMIEDESSEMQKRLASMKSDEGIISLTEQNKILLEKYKTFDVARTTVQKEIISRRSKIEAIQKLRKSRPQFLIPSSEIAQNPIIEDMENKLSNMDFHLTTLKQRYTADTPQVVTAEEQVVKLRSQIKEQVDKFLQREMSDLEKLQAEEQALSKTMQELSAQIKRMPLIELELTNLEKAVGEKEVALSVLRKRYQDSLVAGAADSRLENVKVISPASVPIRPATPNLPLNLTLGLILALVVGFSTAFFLEYWDDSLKVPEDVERRLGVPVFASIPEL